ncbi:MAG: M13 family metallopeptidase [Segniliparus sp.]|uniref:M13 family metallopeptidase n=1 Tax=Segniliparus sp. TaxID=2804064 RepID=UPI003F2EA53B
MRFVRLVAPFVVVAVAAGCSQAGGGESAADYQAKAFDVGGLGASAEACDSLFGYVNQKWLDARPIPDDRSSLSIDTKLSEDDLALERSLAQDAGSEADPASVRHKVGLLYKEASDEGAIEQAGTAPLKDRLDKIAAIASPEDVAALLREFAAEGDPIVLRLSARADFRDATKQVASVSEEALGLPSKDYYTDPQYKPVLDAYRDYARTVLGLLGEDQEGALRSADALLALESAFADVSLSEVEQREVDNQFKFVPLDEAQRLVPHLDWQAFFAAQRVSAAPGFSLPETRFFQALDQQLAGAPLDQWKAYLAFHVADHYSAALPKAFRDSRFVLDQAKSGATAPLPTFKRALSVVEDNIGEGLGQLYVAAKFPKETKEAVLALVRRVVAAMGERIDRLDWMSPETKAKAKEKLGKILPKIGYPDHWRDWSGLALGGKGLVSDIRAAEAFEHAYQLAKIGRPTDRQEWDMTPQTINAYYEPTDNTINFPAAILQAPYFDPKADPALNYGAIGAVIGHEMTHAFDDEGSQFDGDGNRANWWTAEDRKEFEERTGKLADQYNAYVPLPGHPDAHVDGRLTLGENIADLGGTLTAFDALAAELGGRLDGPKIAGFAPAQRFFLAYARSWRGKRRDEAVLEQIASDPHSPEKYRVDGVAPNVPAFARAFGCAPGSPMAPAEAQLVSIW